MKGGITMNTQELHPFEQEVLDEMRERIGDEADNVFERYWIVIAKLDHSLYTDEIAGNIIYYSQKGVTPQEWVSHIDRNNRGLEKEYSTPNVKRFRKKSSDSDELDSSNRRVLKASRLKRIRKMQHRKKRPFVNVNAHKKKSPK